LNECAAQTVPPNAALHWCGSDSVACVVNHRLGLHLYAHGQVLTYAYDTPIVVQTECDGVRVITGAKHVLVGRVPPSVVAVYQISSAAPAAHLLYALQAYKVRAEYRMHSNV
jgi:hypothetical protein